MGHSVITAQTCARIADEGCTSADPSKWGNLSSRHSGTFTAFLARVGQFFGADGMAWASMSTERMMERRRGRRGFSASQGYEIVQWKIYCVSGADRPVFAHGRD